MMRSHLNARERAAAWCDRFLSLRRAAGERRISARWNFYKQQSATIHILGVGKSFFRIEQKSGPAALDQYDFGIAGFNADEARAKLKKRNLNFGSGTSKESFKFTDPDGFLVQLNGPDYTGHVS